MYITEKNCRVADKIIEILVKEECTVDEATEILRGASDEIRRSTTVQVKETLVERYKDNF